MGIKIGFRVGAIKGVFETKMLVIVKVERVPHSRENNGPGTSEISTTPASGRRKREMAGEGEREGEESGLLIIKVMSIIGSLLVPSTSPPIVPSTPTAPRSTPTSSK